jgi:transcription antitermination protein NusB
VRLRSKSREYAMQMLFQWEMSKKEPRKLAEQFWKGAAAADLTENFANELFEGAAKQIKELDELIEQHSEWKLERIPAIDRAILRLAIYELRANTAQRRTVFDEALELAKKYSGEDSTRYLNGILHAVGKTVKES